MELIIIAVTEDPVFNYFFSIPINLSFITIVFVAIIGLLSY